MLSLLLSLALAPASFAESSFQDDYIYSKAQQYRVELSRYGSSRPSLVLEKSDRNRICQKVANSAPYTHYVYACYSVSEVGTSARDTYERESSAELDLQFRSLRGSQILGTGMRQKFTASGFCRVTVYPAPGVAPHYLCYSANR